MEIYKNPAFYKTLGELAASLGKSGSYGAKIGQYGQAASESWAASEAQKQAEEAAKKKQQSGILGDVGSVVGGALGSVVAPGVGTALGATLGSAGGQALGGGGVDPTKVAMTGVSSAAPLLDKALTPAPTPALAGAQPSGALPPINPTTGLGSGEYSGYQFGTTTPSMIGKNTGMIKPGNINLYNRAIVPTGDGGYATVASASGDFGNGEVLYPQTARDGSKVLNNTDAVKQMQQTGETLGTFGPTPPLRTDAAWRNADKYAEALHNDQANMYDAEAQKGLAPVAGSDGAAAGNDWRTNVTNYLNDSHGGVAGTAQWLAGSPERNRVSVSDTLKPYPGLSNEGFLNLKQSARADDQVAAQRDATAANAAYRAQSAAMGQERLGLEKQRIGIDQGRLANESNKVVPIDSFDPVTGVTTRSYGKQNDLINQPATPLKGPAPAKETVIFKPTEAGLLPITTKGASYTQGVPIPNTQPYHAPLADKTRLVPVYDKAADGSIVQRQAEWAPGQPAPQGTASVEEVAKAKAAGQTASTKATPEQKAAEAHQKLLTKLTGEADKEARAWAADKKKYGDVWPKTEAAHFWQSDTTHRPTEQEIQQKAHEILQSKLQTYGLDDSGAVTGTPQAAQGVSVEQQAISLNEQMMQEKDPAKRQEIALKIKSLVGQQQ